MIKSAAKWAEINYGYGNFVRNVPPLKKPVKAAAVFSRDEQRKILTEIRNNPTPTACGILLTMFTGLRIGELCALEWKDIDFNERVLHVTKAVQRISQFGGKAKTNLKVITPKSATSVRDIPLPDFLMKLLENFKGEDDNFVASGSTKICEPRCFTNRYKALLKKANVPSLKFHSLRHTFATNALHQNFDIKTLSEILGHANASITMQVYVHSSMERKAACMSRLQELF
jgi:integrase